MVSYKVKIAIAPVRRDFGGMRMAKGGIWSPEAAQDMLQKVLPYIKNTFANEHVEFVDLSWFNEENFMYEYSQAYEIAEHFKAEKVDALFIANINFGNEESAAKLASLLNVPTLIWSPQEEEFGITETKDINDPIYGGRLLDGQCGLFAISKLLQRYHVTFTEIPTCKVDSPVFAQYFEDFAAVACMIKNFKNMRIMQLGARSQAFTSMMYNEDELLEKFGIEVFPFSPTAAVKMAEEYIETKKDEVDDIVKEFCSYFPNGGKDYENDESFKKSAAIYLMYKDLFEKTGCSAISLENFSFQLGAGGMIDIALSANHNRFVMFEGDTLAGITSVIASSATFGEELPIFGEFTANHPTNPNAELIWHTAVYPPAVASHKNFEPYIANVGGRIQTGLEVEDGEYAICRLDAMDGKYAMLIGDFKTCDGPFTRQDYMWGEFKDWTKFEQATIYGPYVHHLIEIKGGQKVVRRLKEFCRYTGIYADVPDERDTPFCPLYY